MARRVDIYREIIAVLQSGPKNPNQISKEMTDDVHWETVKRALELLKEMGVVLLMDKKYVLSPSYLKGNESALLKFPVSEEQEKSLCELANRFHELSSRPLNKTFLQKMVVEVIKRENLDLPYGLYLFGECTALNFDQSLLSKYGSTNSFDKVIHEVIQDFSVYPNTVVLMRELYQKSNNQVYLSRLKIDKLFGQSFTNETIDLLSFEIKNILFNLHISDDSNIINDVQTYYSTFSWMMKHSLEQIETIRLDLYAAFINLWELIGSYNYYVSSKKFFSVDVAQYYVARNAFLEELFRNKIAHLQSLWPEFPKLNPKLQKLRVALEEESQ